MPQNDLSLRRLLFRYWWPFWIFKDASYGDPYMRAAAYRYNQERRIYLPGYLAKWILLCVFTLLLTSQFESLAAEIKMLSEVFIGLAASSALMFAFGILVLLQTSYIYVYLSGDR